MAGPVSPALPPDSGPVSGRPSRRRLRIALIGFAVLATLTSVLLGAAASWLGSESMLQTVVARAVAASGGRLEVEAPSGSLLGTLRAARVRWTDGAMVASVDDLAVTLDWRGLPARRLRVVAASAARVEVSTPPSDAPLAPPASLALPFGMRVDIGGLDIAELLVRSGDAEPLKLSALHGAARYAASAWTLDALSVRGDFGALRADGTVRDAPPFALSANVLLETRVLDEPIAIASSATGDLSALAIEARTVLREASANARLRLAPFSPRPLLAADVGIANLDLARFGAGLPATRLEGRLQGTAPPAAAGSPVPALPALGGTLSLRNTRPGTLDAALLPVETAATRFAFDGALLRLDGLAVAGPPGRLEGDATLRVPAGGARLPTEFALRLATQGIDLQRAHAALRPTALRGEVRVAPARGGLAFDGRLSDGELSLDAQALLVGERLSIARARLQAREGIAEFAGSAGIAPPYRFDLAGTVARLDPARFADVPEGLLNGRWRVTGEAGPEPSVEAEASLSDSRWRGQALSGRASGRWQPDRVSRVDAALRWGGATASARGGLGAPGDRLAVAIDVARLQELDARFGGRLGLEATLRDALREPGLAATVTGRALRIEDRLSVRSLRAAVEVARPAALREVLVRLGVVEAAPPAAPAAPAAPPARAQTPAPARGGSGGVAAKEAGAAAGAGKREASAARGGWSAATSALSVTLQADGLQLAGTPVDALRVELAGDADRHGLAVRASAAGRAGVAMDAALRVEGGLERGAPPRWRGRLVEASNVVAPRLRLLQPAELALSGEAARAGPLRLEIDGADGARLQLDTASWEAGRLRLQGALSAVPLRWLAPWVADSGLKVNEPDALRLGVRIDVAGAPGAAGELRARIEAFRESGDLSIEMPAAGGGVELLRAGLQALEARIDVADGRMSATASMRGSAIGTLRAEARAPLAWTPAGRLDTAVALEGGAELSVPSLAFTRALAGEAWRFDGALQARLALAGTLGAPRVTGRIEGTRLAAEQRELGMKLVDGELAASITDNAVVIERLRFASGQGSVSMTGSLRADERSEAVLVLDRMPIPLGAGQRLLLSGEARAALRGGLLTLRGRLRADEGVIELTAYDTPSLSRDVVVVRDAAEAAARASRRAAERRGATQSAAAEADPAAGKGFRILSNLEIDLGDRFRVFGAGVDARLVGQLTLGGRLPDAPRLNGTVRVAAQGTYTGFGQKLEIERGVLVFSGPVDNPSIDLVAYRRYLPVEAGVSLTGTARVPKLTLVSKPDVPELDKLSWLVLGIGSDSARSGGQNSALQAAAATILAAADPSAAGPGIASTFGLDVLSVRTAQVGSTGESGSAATSAQDSIVTLGKRLTDRLFVSYEQSLRGLQNLLRLQYEITERLSVRTKSGTQNAVDLLWTYRYD
jgi:translocation and assembly module TamB